MQIILQCFRLFVTLSILKLNNDLNKVNLWANKWKMSFNPDHINKAKVIFSGKINKVYHPPLLFNNSTVQRMSSQRHLGIHLDEELTLFKHHINELICINNRPFFYKTPSGLW